MPDQARFLDFMDMIDGGGAGRMGDKFEGGGIFSALANLIATPYGSEDAGRKAKREAAYRAAGLLAPEEAEAEAAPIAAPAVRRTKPTREELMSARAAEMERQRGLQQDQFDPRNQQGATSFRVPVAPEYRSMDQAVGGAQYPSMYRSMDSVVGGMGAPDMPLPRVGNQAVPLRTHGAEFYKQPNIAPDYVGDYTRRQDYSTRAPYPSAMSPSAPAMPQGVMSFRDFVDAERAAMSGADRYLDPANYQRGYARYLSSMGITPEMMGM